MTNKDRSGYFVPEEDMLHLFDTVLRNSQNSELKSDGVIASDVESNKELEFLMTENDVKTTIQESKNRMIRNDK